MARISAYCARFQLGSEDWQYSLPEVCFARSNEHAEVVGHANSGKRQELVAGERPGPTQVPI